MANKGTKGAHILHDLRVTLTGAEWVERAACSPEKAELFWPLKGQSGSALEPALKLCSRCQVVDECRDWAVDNYQTDGIWGGLQPGELKRLVEARRAAEAEPVHPVTRVPVKTHCANGHKLKPYTGLGSRWPCNTCNNEARRRSRQRKREAQTAEVTSC